MGLIPSCCSVRQHGHRPPLLMLWFLQCGIYCAGGEFQSGAKCFGRLFPGTWGFKLLALAPHK